MPITHIHYEDGVFYCQEEGDITPDDAIRWANHAEQFAEKANTPIVALIDATHCNFISAKARTIFARASATPSLHCVVVATNDMRVSQSIQLIAMMARQQHTHIFDTIEEAATFAYEQASTLHNNGASV